MIEILIITLVWVCGIILGIVIGLLIAEERRISWAERRGRWTLRRLLKEDDKCLK